MGSLQEDNYDKSLEDISVDFANITTVISDESDLENDNLSDLDCDSTCSHCDVEDEIFINLEDSVSDNDFETCSEGSFAIVRTILNPRWQKQTCRRI